MTDIMKYRETTNDEMLAINSLMDRGEYDKALVNIMNYLDFDFENGRLLYLAGICFRRMNKFGMAYQFMRRIETLGYERPEVQNAIGMVYQNAQDLWKAEKHFQKALAMYPEGHLESDVVLNNLALLYVNQGDYYRALEYSDKCLEVNPNNPEALESRSLALLSLGKWREGWANYESMLGVHKQRQERSYCIPEEPRWGGERDQVVVAYGEQGVGDEVYFSSCIPDLVNDTKTVIIDCDHRLEGLFKRSFPSAIVYGTRFQNRCPWTVKHSIDARVSFGTLPKFYRNEDSDFPGKPWLIPDPERVAQWKALLDTKGDGPIIGLAWTGGNDHTGVERRSVSLEDLLPVLKAVPNARFVSFQYKGDTAKEIQAIEEDHGIKIYHWDRATKQGVDADETVSLLAACDCLVSVTTATNHFAGAIGKKSFCLVNKKPRWLYQQEGKHMVWYGDTVEKFKQREGGYWPVRELASRLVEYLKGEGHEIHNRRRSKGTFSNRGGNEKHGKPCKKEVSAITALEAR